MINQSVLESFQRAKHKIRLMEEGITLKKAKLKDVENEILVRLDEKEKVEKGKLKLEIDITERRTVGWKAIVEKELGVTFATKMLQNTKPVKYRHIAVKDVEVK